MIEWREKEIVELCCFRKSLATQKQVYLVDYSPTKRMLVIERTFTSETIKKERKQNYRMRKKLYHSSIWKHKYLKVFRNCKIQLISTF